jgi:hypothetical protein
VSKNCTDAKKLLGEAFPGCCNSCHEEDDMFYPSLLDTVDNDGNEWECCCKVVEILNQRFKNDT